MKWTTRYFPEPIRQDFKDAIDRSERFKSGAVSDMLQIMFSVARLSETQRKKKLFWHFPDIELPSLDTPMQGLLFVVEKEIAFQEARRHNDT